MTSSNNTLVLPFIDDDNDDNDYHMGITPEMIQTMYAAQDYLANIPKPSSSTVPRLSTVTINNDDHLKITPQMMNTMYAAQKFLANIPKFDSSDNTMQDFTETQSAIDNNNMINDVSEASVQQTDKQHTVYRRLNHLVKLNIKSFPYSSNKIINVASNNILYVYDDNNTTWQIESVVPILNNITNTINTTNTTTPSTSTIQLPDNTNTPAVMFFPITIYNNQQLYCMITLNIKADRLSINHHGVYGQMFIVMKNDTHTGLNVVNLSRNQTCALLRSNYKNMGHDTNINDSMIDINNIDNYSPRKLPLKMRYNIIYQNIWNSVVLYSFDRFAGAWTRFSHFKKQDSKKLRRLPHNQSVMETYGTISHIHSLYEWSKGKKNLIQTVYVSFPDTESTGYFTMYLKRFPTLIDITKHKNMKQKKKKQIITADMQNDDNDNNNPMNAINENYKAEFYKQILKQQRHVRCWKNISCIWQSMLDSTANSTAFGHRPSTGQVLYIFTSKSITEHDKILLQDKFRHIQLDLTDEKEDKNITESILESFTLREANANVKLDMHRVLPRLIVKMQNIIDVYCVNETDIYIKYIQNNQSIAVTSLDELIVSKSNNTIVHFDMMKLLHDQSLDHDTYNINGYESNDDNELMNDDEFADEMEKALEQALHEEEKERNNRKQVYKNIQQELNVAKNFVTPTYTQLKWPFCFYDKPKVQTKQQRCYISTIVMSSIAVVFASMKPNGLQENMTYGRIQLKIHYIIQHAMKQLYETCVSQNQKSYTVDDFDPDLDILYKDTLSKLNITEYGKTLEIWVDAILGVFYNLQLTHLITYATNGGGGGGDITVKQEPIDNNTTTTTTTPTAVSTMQNMELNKLPLDTSVIFQHTCVNFQARFYEIDFHHMFQGIEVPDTIITITLLENIKYRTHNNAHVNQSFDPLLYKLLYIAQIICEIKKITIDSIDYFNMIRKIILLVICNNRMLIDYKFNSQTSQTASQTIPTLIVPVYNTHVSTWCLTDPQHIESNKAKIVNGYKCRALWTISINAIKTLITTANKQPPGQAFSTITVEAIKQNFYDFAHVHIDSYDVYKTASRQTLSKLLQFASNALPIQAINIAVDTNTDTNTDAAGDNRVCLLQNGYTMYSIQQNQTTIYPTSYISSQSVYDDEQHTNIMLEKAGFIISGKFRRKDNPHIFLGAKSKLDVTLNMIKQENKVKEENKENNKEVIFVADDDGEVKTFEMNKINLRNKKVGGSYSREPSLMLDPTYSTNFSTSMKKFHYIENISPEMIYDNMVEELNNNSQKATVSTSVAQALSYIASGYLLFPILISFQMYMKKFNGRYRVEGVYLPNAERENYAIDELLQSIKKRVFDKANWWMFAYSILLLVVGHDRLTNTDMQKFTKQVICLKDAILSLQHVSYDTIKRSFIRTMFADQDVINCLMFLSNTPDIIVEDTTRRWTGITSFGRFSAWRRTIACLMQLLLPLHNSNDNTNDTDNQTLYISTIRDVIQTCNVSSSDAAYPMMHVSELHAVYLETANTNDVINSRGVATVLPLPLNSIQYLMIRDLVILKSIWMMFTDQVLPEEIWFHALSELYKEDSTVTNIVYEPGKPSIKLSKTVEKHSSFITAACYTIDVLLANSKHKIDLKTIIAQFMPKMKSISDKRFKEHVEEKELQEYFKNELSHVLFVSEEAKRFIAGITAFAKIKDNPNRQINLPETGSPNGAKQDAMVWSTYLTDLYAIIYADHKIILHQILTRVMNIASVDDIYHHIVKILDIQYTKRIKTRLDTTKLLQYKKLYQPKRKTLNKQKNDRRATKHEQVAREEQIRKIKELKGNIGNVAPLPDTSIKRKRISTKKRRRNKKKSRIDANIDEMILSDDEDDDDNEKDEDIIIDNSNNNNNNNNEETKEEINPIAVSDLSMYKMLQIVFNSDELVNATTNYPYQNIHILFIMYLLDIRITRVNGPELLKFKDTYNNYCVTIPTGLANAWFINDNLKKQLQEEFFDKDNIDIESFYKLIRPSDINMTYAISVTEILANDNVVITGQENRFKILYSVLDRFISHNNVLKMYPYALMLRFVSNSIQYPILMFLIDSGCLDLNKNIGMSNATDTLIAELRTNYTKNVATIQLYQNIARKQPWIIEARQRSFNRQFRDANKYPDLIEKFAASYFKHIKGTYPTVLGTLSIYLGFITNYVTLISNNNTNYKNLPKLQLFIQQIKIRLDGYLQK
jgi:hypothetical protein